MLGYGQPQKILLFLKDITFWAIIDEVFMLQRKLNGEINKRIYSSVMREANHKVQFLSSDSLFSSSALPSAGKKKTMITLPP